MEIAEHIAHLERDGIGLADAADAAGPDVAVPSCPQWTVRDLVVHCGGVHRWAASIVRDRLDHDPTPDEDDLEKPGDQDLIDWFREGHAALVQTLREASVDVECFTFLPAPSPLAFWARRQAHETAIHRADAELASGPIAAYDKAFALDGMDEMLAEFASRRRSFRHVDRPRTLAVRPRDADAWLVTLAPDGIRTEHSDSDAECAVSASASDLYLWLWNRPAVVDVTGDRTVADLWRSVRIRW